MFLPGKNNVFFFFFYQIPNKIGVIQLSLMTLVVISL